MDDASSARQAGRPDLVPAGLAFLGVLALSTTLAVLALKTASGVTYLGGTSYRTEFVNQRWWFSGFLLVVPVFLASWRHPKLAFLAVTAALGPQVVLPTALVYRSIDGGWGDGLEFFGYVWAILMMLLFTVAASVGAAAGRRKQPSHDG